jgi:hypothetical protein
MAPVAGGIANGQENRLVLLLRRFQGAFIPGLPMHRIVTMLQKIWAGFARQAVCGHFRSDMMAYLAEQGSEDAIECDLASRRRARSILTAFPAVSLLMWRQEGGKSIEECPGHNRKIGSELTAAGFETWRLFFDVHAGKISASVRCRARVPLRYRGVRKMRKGKSE